MREGKKLPAMLTKSWKKSFISGVVILTKIRFCNECYSKILCTKCNTQTNENKVFAANLNLIKQEASYDIDQMLPYFKNRMIYL